MGYAKFHGAETYVDIRLIIDQATLSYQSIFQISATQVLFDPAVPTPGSIRQHDVGHV